MNFGFNSNVHASDSLYHVQTEDRGPAHPYLDTVVYESGRVVYKRSTSYEAFAATSSQNADFPEQLHELLSQQHREVIAELEAGKLALPGKTKAQTEIPAPPTAGSSEVLHIRLLNPKTWLVAGGAAPEVTLEIEVQRKNSEKAVGDAEVEALLEHEKERVHCLVARTDGAGRVTLKFPMPPSVTEGSSLLIRASDGSVHGELRFRLKAKRPVQVTVPVLK